MPAPVYAKHVRRMNEAASASADPEDITPDLVQDGFGYEAYG